MKKIPNLKVTFGGMTRDQPKRTPETSDQQKKKIIRSSADNAKIVVQVQVTHN
jgi:hypothetical protein